MFFNFLILVIKDLRLVFQELIVEIDYYQQAAIMAMEIKRVIMILSDQEKNHSKGKGLLADKNLIKEFKN